ARPVRSETLVRVLASSSDDARSLTASPENSALPKPSAPGALSILVAEDNDINALLARSALSKGGHKVKIVGNGKAAVDAVRAEHFDVVLMDLHMPVMDGLDAI